MGFVVRISIQSTALGYLAPYLVSRFELSKGFLCLLLCLRHPDIVKLLFHFWLNRFWDLVVKPPHHSFPSLRGTFKNLMYDNA